MLFLTFFLTFGQVFANFERPVLGCIDAEVNTRWKALDEIYKMYTYASLHLSAFKNSAKVRQTFSHFYGFIFEISLIFRNFCANFNNFRGEISGNFKFENLGDFDLLPKFSVQIAEIPNKIINIGEFWTTIANNK